MEKRSATLISRLLRRCSPGWILLCAFIILLSAPAAAYPEMAAVAGPFSKGSVRMSIILGSGSAFDKDYTILGAGFGYYVIDGLEAGIDTEAWMGSTPNIYEVSPQVRYVVRTVTNVKPYVGGFYRRTFIEGFEDQNSAGFRAGALFVTGRRAYFGAGLVYDIHLNCDKSIYSSCSETYPELLFAVIF